MPRGLKIKRHLRPILPVIVEAAYPLPFVCVRRVSRRYIKFSVLRGGGSALRRSGLYGWIQRRNDVINLA
jgi:hypothetical protein